MNNYHVSLFFYITYIVWLWHDSALQSKILISVHSVFPSVYVWGRQWGAWSLHPYNSDAQKFMFYHIICPFSSIWNESHGLAVMVVLQIAPRTRTKLVEASQHHVHKCLLSQSFMLTQSVITYSTFCVLVAVTEWWPPWHHVCAAMLFHVI